MKWHPISPHSVMSTQTLCQVLVSKDLFRLCLECKVLFLNSKHCPSNIFQLLRINQSNRLQINNKNNRVGDFQPAQQNVMNILCITDVLDEQTRGKSSSAIYEMQNINICVNNPGSMGIVCHLIYQSGCIFCTSGLMH